MTPPTRYIARFPRQLLKAVAAVIRMDIKDLIVKAVLYGRTGISLMTGEPRGTIGIRTGSFMMRIAR